MIFIDTGYLVALADDSDELHARALAWSDAIEGPTLTTDSVLVEAVNLLSGPADRNRIHRLLDALGDVPRHEMVVVDRARLDEGLRLHRERADKSWSLTDCISFNIMRERGILRALAYDHHSEQAGFDAILRRDP